MGLRCKFDSATQLVGKCKTYFSLPKNTPIYAKEEHDLLICSDGYGTLDIIDISVLNIKNFSPGLYRCGKELTS